MSSCGFSEENSIKALIVPFLCDCRYMKKGADRGLRCIGSHKKAAAGARECNSERPGSARRMAGHFGVPAELRVDAAGRCKAVINTFLLRWKQ